MQSDPVARNVKKSKEKKEKKIGQDPPNSGQARVQKWKKSEIVRGNAGRESRAFSKPVRSSEEKRKF